MKKIENYNILVIDTNPRKVGAKYTRAGFDKQEEAQDYMDNHERPQDLVCVLNPVYKKAYLDNFETNFKLTRQDVKILRLIQLKNPVKTIKKIYGEVVHINLTRLRNNNLIAYNSITGTGIKFLESLDRK